MNYPLFPSLLPLFAISFYHMLLKPSKVYFKPLFASRINNVLLYTAFSTRYNNHAHIFVHIQALLTSPNQMCYLTFNTDSVTFSEGKQ